MSGSDSAGEKLIVRRPLARNAVYSLLGQGLPLFAALIAFPLLIKALGTDRFGILSLAWVLIGYFSLFDLGLGRALTKLVAEKLGAGAEREIPDLVWSALALMFVLGVVGAILVALVSPWLVGSVLKIPHELQAETLHSFFIIAVSTPIVITTTGLRGILEARQMFGLVNAIRIPMGLFTFLGPLLVLPVTSSLAAITGVLLVGRVIAWMVHFYYCLKIMPSLRHGAVKIAAMGPLTRFGAWMSVTNTVGPLMVYLDRFAIGALISAAAVAYYTTPYEVVTKLSIVAGALSSVLFPAFASSMVEDRERAAWIYKKGVIYLLALLFPPILLVVAFARPWLEIWLGPEFAQNGFQVMQWLAAGVLCNSLAQIPFALIQGAGRPDLTAKLHLVELPFYFGLLWWMLSGHGIVGAAMAWSARTAADALVLFYLARTFVPGASLAREARVAAAAFVLLLAAALINGLGMKVWFVIATLAVYAPLAWMLVFVSRERAFSLNARNNTANG